MKTKTKKKSPKNKYTYVAYEDNELELTAFATKNILEMANFLECPVNMVRQFIWRNENNWRGASRMGYRVVRI